MNNTDTFEAIARDAVGLLAAIIADLLASDDLTNQMIAPVIAAETDDLCRRSIALGGPQNPDRDYPIIDARKALLAAQEELALKKTPYAAALEVQDKRQRWDAKRKLTLVKKRADDEQPR